MEFCPHASHSEQQPLLVLLDLLLRLTTRLGELAVDRTSS
jgi:hypothetical protein